LLTNLTYYSQVKKGSFSFTTMYHKTT